MIQSSSDGSDTAARARTERLLRGANDVAALRHRLPFENAPAPHPLAPHYNPDQPRVPKGNPDGGEWTSTGSSGVRPAALDRKSEGPILMGRGPTASWCGPSTLRLMTMMRPQSKTRLMPKRLPRLRQSC